MLFLDLDDFKTVNDSLGHAEGDRLLIAAAERFLACARTADTVARLGGDEFAILIEGADGREGLPERLGDAMAHPFTLSGNEVRVTASIGVAAAVAATTRPTTCSGTPTWRCTPPSGAARAASATYESRMYADVRERLELEAALRRAIERNELVLHYQPIVELKTGAIYGVEALVRWDHPQYGHLLPQHFIPLAEETGLIVQLGALGAARGLPPAAGVARGSIRDLPLAVSVNISGRQLQGDGAGRGAAAGARRRRASIRRRWCWRSPRAC